MIISIVEQLNSDASWYNFGFIVQAQVLCTPRTNSEPYDPKSLGPTYSLCCNSSDLMLPYRILNIKLVKPKKELQPRVQVHAASSQESSQAHVLLNRVSTLIAQPLLVTPLRTR